MLGLFIVPGCIQLILNLELTQFVLDLSDLLFTLAA